MVDDDKIIDTFKVASVVINLMEKETSVKVSKEAIYEFGDKLLEFLKSGYDKVVEEDCKSIEGLLLTRAVDVLPEEIQLTIIEMGKLYLKNGVYLALSASHGNTEFTIKELKNPRRIDAVTDSKIYKNAVNALEHVSEETLTNLGREPLLVIDALNLHYRSLKHAHKQCIIEIVDFIRSISVSNLNEFSLMTAGKNLDEIRRKENTKYCKRLAWAIVSLKYGVIVNPDFIDNDYSYITEAASRMGSKIYNASMCPTCTPAELRVRIKKASDALRRMDWYGHGPVGMTTILSSVINGEFDYKYI